MDVDIQSGDRNWTRDRISITWVYTGVNLVTCRVHQPIVLARYHTRLGVKKKFDFYFSRFKKFQISCTLTVAGNECYSGEIEIRALILNVHYQKSTNLFTYNL
eukprot:sb/3478179/